MKKVLAEIYYSKDLSKAYTENSSFHVSGSPEKDTHIVMGYTEFEVEDEFSMEYDVLEYIFAKFNWCHEEQWGLAPKAVNFRARETKTHASLSVGDVAIIHMDDSTTFWKCVSFGWECFFKSSNRSGVHVI